jgi:hypothetical protein
VCVGGGGEGVKVWMWTGVVSVGGVCAWGSVCVGGEGVWSS